MSNTLADMERIITMGGIGAALYFIYQAYLLEEKVRDKAGEIIKEAVKQAEDLGAGFVHPENVLNPSTYTVIKENKLIFTPPSSAEAVGAGIKTAINPTALIGGVIANTPASVVQEIFNPDIGITKLRSGEKVGGDTGVNVIKAIVDFFSGGHNYSKSF